MLQIELVCLVESHEQLHIIIILLDDLYTI